MARRAKPENFQGTFGTADNYNSAVLNRKYTAKELRSEYRKMRKEAKGRIKELKKEGFEDSPVLENKEYLDENPSNLTKRELAYYLSYTASFLNSDLSTTDGQKRQRESIIQTFHDMGYKNIDSKNFDRFGKYMNKMRTYIKNKIYGSDEIVEMYDKAQENNISIANLEKNISFFMENADAIDELGLNPDRKRAYTKNEIEKIMAKRGY